MQANRTEHCIQAQIFVRYTEFVTITSMQILDGKTTALKIREDVAAQAAQLKQRGVTPGLGTILVGDDAASATYIGAKHKACEEVGITSIHKHLPADVSQAELLREI